MSRCDEWNAGRSSRRSHGRKERLRFHEHAASEEDDRTLFGKPAHPEAGQHLPTIEGQESAECVPMQLEHLAVVLRIRDHEDHHINLAIPLLESDPAFERLDVTEAHFQLAAGCSSEEDRDAVPRTAVAGERERHLRSADRVAGKSSVEPFSEPKLRGISCGITVRVRLDGDAQADRCGRTRS